VTSVARMLPVREVLDKLTFSLAKRLVMGMPPSSRVDLWARQLGRRIRRYGPGDPRTLQARLDYAVARHRNGEGTAAAADLADLIERSGDAPAPGDKLIRVARAWRGRILSDLGRLEEAERELRELAQETDRLLGAKDLMSLEAHQSHAVILHKIGLTERAEAELAEVVALRTAVSGADAEATVQARRAQAEMLGQLGRFGDSETAWRQVVEAYDRHGKQAHPDALRAQEKHAVALYKLGRFHQAAAELVQLADRLAATRGAGHPDTLRVRAWRDDACSMRHGAPLR
jgi:tetratricopeptide (TPR) repeat protein